MRNRQDMREKDRDREREKDRDRDSELIISFDDIGYESISSKCS